MHTQSNSHSRYHFIQSYIKNQFWTCCRLSHTWVTWQKYSSHSVCPWGQVSNQGCHLVLDSSIQAQLLTKPRGVDPIKLLSLINQYGDFKLNELLRSLKFNQKQPQMTRYKMSARKHNAETQYIYRKKITNALKWSQKEINILACAWSECFAIASWYVLS